MLDTTECLVIRFLLPLKPSKLRLFDAIKRSLNSYQLSIIHRGSEELIGNTLFTGFTGQDLATTQVRPISHRTDQGLNRQQVNKPPRCTVGAADAGG